MAGAYAGDVTPADAWATLQANPSAALVDVRTVAEWSFVGVPDLGGLAKRALFQEWQSYPSMQVDPAFADRVAEALGAAGAGADAPVFFLCRSGARSQAAAAALTARGYTQCFNIAGGFEGPLDSARHRGRSAGWKAEGLPWMQS
ncbi:rhodanese-like domain-containing protein [Hansschlegelia zhihuaiae]|uniref:Rhodanese-like domain-containing protein n=1 Tax=Hansschlegelia zhihuaiae TaxID=405005 RepID=A0A4Q0MJL4_9HYPH|nr:rhodanese-like domain-containing protein [Hansschlegelia zhihuaiae]RXF73156.1 rhodanese-like domain-containing protein [Hansschlegelia zhihuaiae]